VAEKLAIPHRYVIFCPSVLTDPDAQSWNALFGPPINSHRASIDLPPADNVREFMFTDHPWLAADPTLGPWQETADLDVVRTGAWILPDEQPAPGRAGGVPGRRRTTGVRGLRQHARAAGRRPGRDRGDYSSVRRIKNDRG
jgi:hypothetical protein